MRENVQQKVMPAKERKRKGAGNNLPIKKTLVNLSKKIVLRNAETEIDVHTRQHSELIPDHEKAAPMSCNVFLIKRDRVK